MNCRICNNQNMKTVVDLGEQHLSGVFPRIGTPDPTKAPLELVQCDNCGLVQLSTNIPPEQLYGNGYGYRTGLNQTMKHHVEQIATKAESIVELNHGDLIIDIGSNDGTLLKAYRNEKVVCLGFDHLHFKQYYFDTDINFIPLFFEGFSVKAKIITSIAMFYDLPDPDTFVKKLAETLASDGIWILEQSYLSAMLYKTAFDTICHEHLEYYTLRVIKHLIEAHGLRIFSVEFNGSNGGSFRCYVCHKDAGYQNIDDTLVQVIENETLDFQRFNDNSARIRKVLKEFLSERKKEGKSIHLLGASTKGNVLLQYCGIDYRLVSFAVDVNPDKSGCWTPGTHIPIYTNEFIPPDYYLVLPWHFKEHFIQQQKEYLEGGGQLIFPLPEPVVVSKDGTRPL